jgi:hypothetical protein
VDKYIWPAGVGLYESESLRRVEPFYRSRNLLGWQGPALARTRNQTVMSARRYRKCEQNQRFLIKIVRIDAGLFTGFLADN